MLCHLQLWYFVILFGPGPDHEMDPMEAFSDLPYDIIEDFGRQLHTLEEFARFGAVCKSWRLAAIAVQKEFKEKQTSTLSCFAPPWMMLATYDDDNDPHKGIQKFFSLSSQIGFSLEFPLTQGKACWGSPFGWMVTVGLDDNIHLLNPLSSFQFSLPPLSTLRSDYHNLCGQAPSPPKQLRFFAVEKFILSSAPSIEQSCLAMAIASQTEYWLLFVARSGDIAWTFVDTPGTEYVDAIFYKDQFYAIDFDGVLVICDITNTLYPRATKFCSPPEQFHYMDLCYLVEMSGDLVLIERIFQDVQADIWKTKQFNCYKLDLETRSWTELSDLGDNALFLGNNTSFAISTSELHFAESKLKRNCIYFTGHHAELRGNLEFAMGIYHYGENTKEPLYEGEDALSDFSLPVFFMPSL